MGVWNWVNDPTGKRWLLTGYGGKGKTAIGYEFATRIKIEAPKDFAYILWLSAKERHFEEGDIHSQTPSFWDLPSLLDAILKAYGFVEYIDLKLSEKKQRVIELLTHLPA